MFKTFIQGLSRNTFFVFLVIVASLFHLTPLLYENYKLIIIALWLLSMVYFVFSNKRKASSELKKMCVFGICYIVMGLIYSLVGISSGKIMRDMLFSLFVFPMMLLVLMDAKVTKYNVRLLFHVIAIIGAINIIDNIRLSFLYPGITTMTEDTLEKLGLTGFNVGGSPFISMATFYLAIVMIAFLYAKDMVDKFLFLFYAIIAFVFVVFFSFKASSLIYAILIVGIMFVVNSAKRPVKAAVAIGIIGGMSLIFIDPIIHLLISIIDNPRVGSRLLIFTEEGDAYGNANSINSRIDLWFLSLRTWLDTPSNFLFGIGEHSRNDFLRTDLSGIGNHSDFLDILAKYGIIGGIILFNILKRLFIYAKKLADSRSFYMIMVFFVLILMFGFTKKIILPSISIMMFVFFPLCLYYINGSESSRMHA